MPGHTQKKAINLEWVQKGVAAKDETSNTCFYFKHKFQIFFATPLELLPKRCSQKSKTQDLKIVTEFKCVLWGPQTFSNLPLEKSFYLDGIDQKKPSQYRRTRANPRSTFLWTNSYIFWHISFDKNLICPFLSSNQPFNTEILGTGDCYEPINLHNILEALYAVTKSLCLVFNTTWLQGFWTGDG